MREYIRIIGLTVGALCILGAWYLYKKDSALDASRTEVSNPSGPDNRHPLVKEAGVGVLYKFNQETQDTLIAAVEQFCVKSYERDSCVHHLSTCGHPCLVVIPRDKRKHIVDDYKALRAARGLPPLQALPKDD